MSIFDAWEAENQAMAAWSIKWPKWEPFARKFGLRVYGDSNDGSVTFWDPAEDGRLIKVSDEVRTELS